MTAPAILCDTGALLSYLDARAPDHRIYRKRIDEARARYVPGLVLAELDYFLRDDRRAMRAFIDDVENRAFLYSPPTDGQLARAMQIDAAYASLRLGLVDASIVALAEETGIVRIATRDVRHFSAVRLADGRAFDLIALPSVRKGR
ncbi:MAG TPA: PIN domain-containing protein [Polyangiaceae bacterium]